MSKLFKIVGIAAVVGVLALATVVVVSADESQGNARGWAGSLAERLHEAIATALGITVEQYDTAIDTARGQVLQQAVDEGLLNEGQAERMQDGWGEGFFGCGRGFGGHMGGFGGGYGMMGPGNSLMGVAAEELDLTVQELADELEAGQSIADVAQDKGVELQSIADAWLADRSAWLTNAVKAERITQEQTDEMLSHMEEEVLEHLQASWPWEHDPEECAEHMLEGLGGVRGGHMMGGRGFGGYGL